jgi:hypothetical protein
MKAYSPAIIGMLLSLFIISCGQDTGEKKSENQGNAVPNNTDGLSIETKDVKGKIQAGDHVKVGSSTLVNNDGTFEEATLGFDHKAGLNIYPAKMAFDTLKSRLKEKLNIWGTYEKLEENDSSFFYKTVSKTGGINEEGYNFLILKKGKTHNYILNGEGENPLKPIADKALAEKIYAIARTFVPAD